MVGSHTELTAALHDVPQLLKHASHRGIVQLRPFRDLDDMLKRVKP